MTRWIRLVAPMVGMVGSLTAMVASGVAWIIYLAFIVYWMNFIMLTWVVSDEYSR